MTKITPGPWQHIPSELNPKKHSYAITDSIGTNLIADVYRKRHWDGRKNTDAPEVTEANAKLLAAAPELLEALKGCVTALKTVASFGGTKPFIDRAMLAIEKAEKL